MIYIPKYTNVEVELPKVRGEYEGWFTFETFRGIELGSGRVLEIAGTRRRRAHFKNVILNQGLNYVSTNGGFISEVAVGTGNTPETINDTTLQSFTAGVAGGNSNFTAQGSAPYYGSQTVSWRFGEGVAAGILAEAGIGRGNCNVNGSDLWSRALIKDGAGDPTTVEVTANEWLDVSYQLRLYPGQLVDDVGSILISGVSYDYVLRNAIVTSGGAWGAYLDAKFPANDGASPIGEGRVYAAGSTLGAVTSSPSGTSDNTTNPRIAGSYSTDTYNQDCTWTLSLSDGNLVGGFGAMAFSTNVSVIQMSLDPAVPKDATKIFDFSLNFNWGTRVVIP